MVVWAHQELSGWGRHPVITAPCARPERRSELFAAFRDAREDGLIPFGLGRSYGDAALSREGRVILTRRLDRMLDFDEDTGWLRCEAGVTIEDLIETFAPRGFFPPVVPGTKFVTVGGAIGCNIHGKNHVTQGCFGDHLRSMEILVGDGTVVTCSREDHPELFWATIGGMGLTGLVIAAELCLTPVESQAIVMESIRFEDLSEFFEIASTSRDITHTVAWIDCLSPGGRGIFMRGRHATADEARDLQPGVLAGLADRVKAVADGRFFGSNHLLNPVTIAAFNEVYFRRHPRGAQESVVGLDPFFFPLDAVEHWNHIYGDRGFLQYQMVVDDREAVRECLRQISETGMASFLAVIKEFGDHDHGGLSFPRRGVTLALDFPHVGEELIELMGRLDEVVIAAGGRVYLGKDARLPLDSFRRMYPRWEEWKAVRDRYDPDGVFRSELGRRLCLC